MSLNLTEFVDAANRLYSAVSLPEKGIMVRRQRSSSARNSQGSQDSKMFRPQLNDKSRRLASRKRSTDVSNRLYNKHAEYEMKKHLKRVAEQDKELLGCTF